MKEILKKLLTKKSARSAQALVPVFLVAFNPWA